VTRVSVEGAGSEDGLRSFEVNLIDSDFDSGRTNYRLRLWLKDGFGDNINDDDGRPARCYINILGLRPVGRRGNRHPFGYVSALSGFWWVKSKMARYSTRCEAVAKGLHSAGIVHQG
jgi:hypothetical protein